MVKLSKFWDRHAKGYAKRPVADEASYQKKLAITRDYLKPHMKALELGCGTGTTAIAHAPFLTHIHAVDVSGKMLETAQARANAAHIENITFEQSNIDDLNIADATYDAIMGHSILHLLENKEVVVAKAYEMLKPGGIFITSTACLAGVSPLLKAILPIGRFLGLLPLVEFFSAEELRDSMTKTGFHIDHEWEPKKGDTVFIVAQKA